ncbi:kinesin motor domain protein [Ichthyophthirius multifiliis]|uniref:Kinesin motor domain protein n=1 Tax=Ichthyophthirius multifiliis TaxID=5932 RepID=G0QSD7_ICHMU|nr:kinesin motor domain protein [Ichthyophthirius multifiliis]EGR31884.1 kinesin motor domain protein [Ichthyophthirius multifiliis]|eukprot:XP_004035370.1 kinesin motor domain protein [Ichthyophthirius multifiliis]
MNFKNNNNTNRQEKVRFNGKKTLNISFLLKIKVFVRIRPFIDEDYEVSTDVEDLQNCIQTDKNRLFQFDHIFDPQCNQETVHNQVGEKLINEVFEGYNGALISYGQTGSGKTYSIFGTRKILECDKNSEIFCQQSGIVFRSLKSVFENINTKMNQRQFMVTLSFMEIYMENIYDLLDQNKKRDSLQIREDPNSGIFVNGLIQQTAKTYEEAFNLIREAVKGRITGKTIMNSTSSRSHDLLQIFIEQRWISFNKNQNKKQKHYQKGLLTIIDLAGSERLTKTTSQGIRLEEAKIINKSICSLGNCIAALANLNKNNLKNNNFIGQNQHIPFRDSKLTRIQVRVYVEIPKLIPSMCKSVQFHYEETFSTLLFASRAMLISVDAMKNEDVYYKIVKDNGKISSLSPVDKIKSGKKQINENAQNSFNTFLNQTPKSKYYIQKKTNNISISNQIYLYIFQKYIFIYFIYLFIYILYIDDEIKQLREEVEFLKYQIQIQQKQQIENDYQISKTPRKYSFNTNINSNTDTSETNNQQKCFLQGKYIKKIFNIYKQTQEIIILIIVIIIKNSSLYKNIALLYKICNKSL